MLIDQHLQEHVMLVQTGPLEHSTAAYTPAYACIAQEIDIGCERSGVDTGVEIAQALGLAYAFVCEFEEIASPLRDAATQGGGVHGNGILSKFDIVGARKVEHTCHPVRGT